MLLESKSVSFGTGTVPNWLAFSKQLNEREKIPWSIFLGLHPWLFFFFFYGNKSWMLHYYHFPGTTKYKRFQLKCNCNLLLFLLLLLGTGTIASLLGSVWESRFLCFFPVDKQICYISSSPFKTSELWHARIISFQKEKMVWMPLAEIIAAIPFLLLALHQSL